MHGRRLTWRIGGIGLIACGVVGILRNSVLGAPVASIALSLLADLLWAAAILTLAFGLHREGSVVARKPLGLAAASVVAAWPFVATIVSLAATPTDAAATDTEAWPVWVTLSIVLPVMAGLIAAVQVGRARVVPRPWNWAPLWVLAGQVVLWVQPQLLGASAPSTLVQIVGLLNAIGTLSSLAATLGLGVLAVILASRSGAGTVAVFQSSTSE
jgi:hypothetical protein